jgi:predicted O-methyltransferase YrrM
MANIEIPRPAERGQRAQVTLDAHSIKQSCLQEAQATSKQLMNKIQDYYSQPIKKSADGKSYNVLGGDAVMPTEARQLAGLVLSERLENILEVGTGLGASVVAMAAALEELGKGSVVTLDPFQEKFGNIGISELQRLGLDPWSKFFPELAENFLYKMYSAHQVVDMVFLDGAHSIGMKMTHTFFASRCLRPGGIFAFHDVTLPCTAACVKYLWKERGYALVKLEPESPANRLLRTVKYSWVYGRAYGMQVIPASHRNLIVLRSPR